MITFPTSTTLQPDQTSSENPTPDMIKVQFGNGFIHSLPNGNNNLRSEWDPMNWSGLNQADLGTLNTFLTSMATTGDYTAYTSPMTGKTYNLIIDGKWLITNQGGQTYSVQATFTQIIT
jgi:phage-related protein